jgi:hypothetical protein
MIGYLLIMKNKERYKKKFGVYHWDTFDNDTWLVEDFDTLTDAKDFIKIKYEGRLTDDGADKVDIVDEFGAVVAQFNVG